MVRRFPFGIEPMSRVEIDDAGRCWFETSMELSGVLPHVTVDDKLHPLTPEPLSP